MITRFNQDNHVKNLPDAYLKTPDSNNTKLLSIEKEAVDLLRAETRAIYDSLDLEQATGATLDLYGEMLGQDRGAATDEQYRALLKSRIIRNLSGADHDSIVNAICITFGCSPEEIALEETDGECAVVLSGIPYDAINKINIDMTTAVQIVKMLIPAGVGFDALTFAGTFEFGGTEMVYDEEKGFGNVEQTIGGTLGLVPDVSNGGLPV